MPSTPTTPDRMIDECLGPLMMHLRRTQIAYRQYMEDGQPFRRALVLWESNRAMRDLLLAKGYLLPDALQEHAARIIAHVDTWASLWTAHQQTKQPRLDDTFAFENEDRFPGDAETALKAYYAQVSRSG